MDHRTASQTVELALALRSEIAGLSSDEDVIRDTLEGEIDLDDVLDYLLLSIADDEAMVEALNKQVSQLNKRSKRLTARIDASRALIRKGLETAGWPKRERPLATLSLNRKSPALGKLDESKIPAHFWVQPDPTLDRTKLLSALINKEVVPGADLAQDDLVLSIRRS